MIRKKVMAAIAVLLMASVISTFAGVTSANAQPPILPDSFYGSLTVNTEPAPAGVTLVAKIDGVVRGDFTTEQIGNYGYLEAGQPKLLVEGVSDDIGKDIHFYIENYDGTVILASNDPTPIFESGADPREIDLIFEGVQLEAHGDGAGPAPSLTVETTLFGVAASFSISDEGVILETIEATTEDGMLTLTIPEGNIALDKYGNPLDSLEGAIDESPPDPPEDAHIIGLTYDFGPDGATFDPPITLTWSYDPDALPEGVAEEDLVLAYYDEVAGEWVELEGCVVDTENNTITAPVSHFTCFAIIGIPPAAFTCSSLIISPTEVAPAEKVNISISVANTGGTEGSYSVVLKINGVKEAEKNVTVAAGGSQSVSFSVAREEAGSYSVTIDGLSGSFTVAVPPAPAAFSLAALSIQPARVKPDEAVTVSLVVANTGGESGSYAVTLKINGVKEAEKSITIAAGGSQTVSFSVTRQEAGSYTVDVDGLTGIFTMVIPPPPVKPAINWPLIGGIIAAVVVVGLLIFFLRRKRAV